LIGLEKSFKILKDVVNVMAQTKRSLEDTTHLDTNVKRFKEMARDQKRRKIIEGEVWILRLSNF
jgi:hypothetical protein